MTTRLHPAFLTLPLAHRGLHDAADGVIENSMGAIKRAIDAGFGIEIDVQLSADNAAMVFHDNTLDRLTDQTGNVAARTAELLGATKLTNSNETIPTLLAVLALIDGQVPLVIEIKDQDGQLGPNIGPLEDAVAVALETYTGSVAIMSFNPHSIEHFKGIAPDRANGLVTDPMGAADWPDVPTGRRKALASLRDAERLGVDFISHNVKNLASAPVARLKKTGMPILCWTVRSAASEVQARKIADNITFEGYLPAGPRP